MATNVVQKVDKSILYEEDSILAVMLRDESKELFLKVINMWRASYGDDTAKYMLDVIKATARMANVQISGRFKMAANSFARWAEGTDLYMQQVAACIEVYGIMFKFGGRVVKYATKLIGTDAVRVAANQTLIYENQLLKMRDMKASKQQMTTFVTTVFGLNAQ